MEPQGGRSCGCFIRPDRLPCQSRRGRMSLFGVTSVTLRNLICPGCGKVYHAALLRASATGSLLIGCPACGAAAAEVELCFDFPGRTHCFPAESCKYLEEIDHAF